MCPSNSEEVIPSNNAVGHGENTSSLHEAGISPTQAEETAQSNDPETDAVDSFFAHQEQRADTTEKNTTPDLTDEAPQDVREFFQTDETKLYETRVNNMRMQFAWATVMLVFAWLFIIIYIVIAHSLGRLFLHTLYVIAWTLLLSTIAAGVAHTITMICYIVKANVKIRQMAAHIALLTACLTGLPAYFILYFLFPIRGDLAFDRLSDSVLTILITTTTASVIGILGAVMFWLFPKKSNPQ